MSKIVPKLNLNKTPQLVDNNSLVMAKNIRLLEDGTIGPDTSLEEIETNTGDKHTREIHHEEIAEDVTIYQYTILDVRTSIVIARGGTIDEKYLDEYAFDFSVDDEDPYDDNYKKSDKDKYIRYEDEALIYCYDFINGNITWNSYKFRYDYNNNCLVNQDGLLFLLAVREDVYRNNIDTSLRSPQFVYLVLPREYVGRSISIIISGVRYNYIVINPVYKTTRVWHHVIQPEYTEIKTWYDTVAYIAQIVGLDNKIYFFKESNYIKYSSDARHAIEDEYSEETFVENPKPGRRATFDVNEDGYITRNGILFKDSSIAATLFPNSNDRVKIFEYDEVKNTFEIVKCAWKYSGGKINGCVTLNNRGEFILTVCEYDASINIPIKHINIKTSTEFDDESIYTQTPKIPISNIYLLNYYAKPIPKGVYQFFIRYEIRKGFYTVWFPCSKELFISNDHRCKTIQGGLKYAERTEDSQLSFVLNVEHLFDVNSSKDNTKFYKSYQLGFIISSETGVVARSWKHFDFTTNVIYFDYQQKDIEEISIDDLLKVNYELFNVGNIASFKDKLYISNYEETDFNQDLQSYANQIDVKFKIKEFETIEGYYLNNKLLTPINESSQVVQEFTNWGEQHVRDIITDRDIINVSFGNTSGALGTGDIWKQSGGARSWMTFDGNNYSVYGSENTYDLHNGTTIYRIYLYILNTTTNEYETYDIINNLQGRDIPNRLDFKDVETYTQSVNNNNVANYIAQLIKPHIVKLYIDTNDVSNSYLTVNCTKDETSYIKELKHNPANSFIVIQYAQNSDINVVHGNYDHYTYTRLIGYGYYPISFIGSIFDSTTIQTRDINEYNTLLPFTKYDFYVHYVKENGIVSNGYFICSKELKRYTLGYEEISDIGDPQSEERAASGWPLSNDDIPRTYKAPETNPLDLCIYDDNTSEFLDYYQDVGMGTSVTHHYRLKKPKNNSAIYPIFDNIICPQDYVACFISIHRSGSDVAQIFNHSVQTISNENINLTRDIGDCLELDCLLYNNLKNIKIVNGVGDYVLSIDGNYKSSSDTEDVTDFGKVGKVVWTNLDERNPDNVDSVCWAIFNNGSSNIDENNLLIKLTPYILLGSSAVSYSIYDNLNLPGYVCRVTKPDRNVADKYYITGNDVYDRDIEGATSIMELVINEEPIDLVSSGATEFIHSNFNLNHIFLRNDLNVKFRTYYEAEEGDENSTSKHQFCYLIDSSIISFIYELHTMYKDYTRKYFRVFNLKNNIIRFDTTIRSSNSNIDEYYKNIYYFDATDYYNVPPNRGIVTNLISIANTLYVHCEHSLFKFTDNKTIDAQDEQVVLQENDIFNSGISEVFDAQYGYAGLQNREQSLITYNAYVFYDAVAKIIYAFGGEQQIGNISEPIKKLIKAIDPIDVKFVGDELHNRFFVNLINNNGNVCLSFNFGSKSFIAVHDITFKFGFHSRRHTYFVHDNMYNGDKIGWSIYRIADNIDGNFIAYQNCYELSLIQIADCDNVLLNPVKSVNACVDVIINTEYEKIKQLDYISWICSEILEYGNDENLVAEEVLNRKYPGTKLRIYSDSTQSDLFELLKSDGDAKISNEERNVNGNDEPNPNPNSWQYPQYNCGVWSMNYFRDVLNTGDIFNYKASKNKITGGSGHSKTTNLTPKTQRENLTQESSLIYGKYFVLRFIFNNKNFKLENVMLKMNDYGKTK